MNTNPLVSVLMPVYNGEKYLGLAIESILNQKYKNLKLIICNDASTDKSKSIILSYSDPRIQYIENETNKGIVETRNRLFAFAKGKYLSIMDSDDIALPEKLMHQICFMERHPDYGVCGTWAKRINDNYKETGYIQMPKKNVYIRMNLLFQSSFVQSSVVLRKSSLGNLLYDPEFTVAEDYDLWERLAQKTKMYNIPKYLLLYRWHDTNISQQKMELMEAKKILIMRRQLKRLDIVTTEEIERHNQIGSLKYFGKEPIDVMLKEAGKWYKQILKKNEEHCVYSTYRFKGFIWYRWFFYCFYFKKYVRGCFPSFFSFNPVVIYFCMNLMACKFKSFSNFLK